MHHERKSIHIETLREGGREERSRPAWLRKGWEAALQRGIAGLSMLGRMHPGASLRRNKVECIRDVAYLPTGEAAHTLDIYRPVGAKGPLPVFLYIHGGGFQLLSKETHWFVGSLLAKRGFVVFNINYRLAPEHRYPAAMQDACAACLWVLEHAQEFGADPRAVYLGGESAGANLATALAVAACYQQTEPWARAIWDAAPRLRGILAGCGVYQVSDMQRFSRRKPALPRWLDVRLLEVADYLPNAQEASPLEWPLADPLCILEEQTPQRKLPPFFTFVGTRDPLLDDTRRLEAALKRQGVTCEARYYPGGIHAFHAFFWSRRGRACWQDQYAFLKAMSASQKWELGE